MQFRGQKAPLAAQLATHFDIDRDLGVIIVADAKAHGIDNNFFQFDRVGDPSALTQGDPVFLAGHPQGIPWSVTVTPDAFIEPDDDSLRFESKSLFPGHSGGALLNFRLEIIGLLRSDQQPNGDALNILEAMAVLKAWGYPVQLSQRFSAAKLETLSAGAGHTCYVNPHGVASCWGENDRGQLGIGTTTEAAQPSAVNGHITFVSISAGFEHTCALTTSAQALCWGDNSSGQLGISLTATYRVVPDDPGSIVPTPTPVYGGLSFSAISAGHDHTCGLTARGQAYCWGGNQYGQLGTGNTRSSTVPVPVLGSHTFSSLRAGTLFSCGVDQTGALYCWGVNSLGQLGDGSLVQRLSPVPVASTLKFTAISAGDGLACGIATNAKAYCWGGNSFGELGVPASKTSPVPAAVSGGLTFATIVAGRSVTYAITEKGFAYSWGSGMEALSVSDDETSENVPARIFGTTKLTLKALSMSFAHACGLTTSGEILCWGTNTHGQLGNGSKEDTVRPTLVSPQP